MDDGLTYRTTEVSDSTELADVTEGLIAQLPSWFGIPEANAAYVESARLLPGFVARCGTEPVGVLLYRRHLTEAAEIHLMAVAPWHRRGVGRTLVGLLAANVTADGCRILQVKTLGAAHPDRGYAHTRAFYRSVGFLPLEETGDLWPGTPCLIMVKWLPAPG
ncbi:GNAT family N-acetyltransferase [Nonomuraea maheshkhaliensis]|uniref:GNAT family N-acetyltransferase n=1 Tax=Nonomuraea maheshkhaliensis TaxID=419590 RepID=A0ABN2HGR0_9ACTN